MVWIWLWWKTKEVGALSPVVRYSNTKLGKKVIDNSGDNEHNAYNVHDNVKQNGRPMPSFCCTNTLPSPVKAIAIGRGPSKENGATYDNNEFEVQFGLDQVNGNQNELWGYVLS